jgi:glutamyl-tRNA synthetase
MEDLDDQRVRAGAAEETAALLRWLGLDWDEGPLVQSEDVSPYRAALEQLREAGHLYPCDATRKEIERAASAPHATDGETRYPGIHRPPRDRMRDASIVERDVLANDGYAWRVVVPYESITFVDRVRGARMTNVQAEVGDFAVATKGGLPAYQLAVVVDDARQGVTDVIRGDDLLNSAPRQMLLYRLMDLGDPPRYWHLPLVAGPDGRRMAKRHDAVRLTTYRDAGVPGERVIGLLAKWVGLTNRRESMPTATFIERLNPDALAYDAPRMTKEDEQWLMDDR